MAFRNRVTDMLQVLFSLSGRERRGVLWFIPVAVILSVVVASLGRPRFDPGLRVAADMTVDPVSGKRPMDEVQPAEPRLFEFDPNTIDYRGLRSLGFSAKVAAGIVKYRSAGKHFRIPEDFATCREVTDSAYFAIEPYIRISPEYALRPLPGARIYPERATQQRKSVRRGDSLFVFDPNLLAAEGFCALGFTPRQAEAIVARREQIAGFRSMDDFARCYVVSEEMFDRLKEYIVIAPPPRKQAPALVDLNDADSAQLTTVRGIGALTAGRIVELRSRLGGFVSSEQLSMVKGMTEANYEKIIGQIWVDVAKIRKIDINFARPESMATHPYIPAQVLRKIVKNRQLKGGWSTTENMIVDGTLTEGQAALLSPYLMFNTNR